VGSGTNESYMERINQELAFQAFKTLVENSECEEDIEIANSLLKSGLIVSFEEMMSFDIPPNLSFAISSNKKGNKTTRITNVSFKL
jgi:hypothetical protein